MLTGGERRGAQLAPTVLAGVDPGMKVVCEEVFGPVASILPYTDFDAVCGAIAASRLGLQCGVFTKSIDIALRAYRRIRTGGVIINGSSTWRTICHSVRPMPRAASTVSRSTPSMAT